MDILRITLRANMTGIELVRVSSKKAVEEVVNATIIELMAPILDTTNGEISDVKVSEIPLIRPRIQIRVFDFSTSRKKRGKATRSN